MSNYDVTTEAASTQSPVDLEKTDLDDFSPDENEGLEEAEIIESNADADETSEELSQDDDSAWADDDAKQYPYEVPRPALTIQEASSILGKSIRSIERSIQGRWGNKLPEGWQARKMKIDGESEWRIIPPPGFRIRHTSSFKKNDTADNTSENQQEYLEPEREERSVYDYETVTETTELETTTERTSLFKGFSIENFLSTASQKAKTEIARAAIGTPEGEFEHPTIVIDRSDDVERLLRELANTQKDLAEERRLHMKDMKLLNQMQNSMRLLEDHASQTSIMKQELIEAREALKLHKQQYQEYVNLPWWKKIFIRTP